MSNPIIQSEIVDNIGENRNQADNSDNAPGARIEAALQGRQQDWLCRETGISDSTLSSMKKAQSIRGDKAVLIARATGVDLEWLLGYGPLHPIKRRGDLQRDRDSIEATALGFEESQLLSMFSELSAREREAIMSMIMVLTGRTVDLADIGRRGSTWNNPRVTPKAEGA